MKRSICLMLALIMAFSLVACGKEPAETPVDPDPKPVEDPVEPDPTPVEPTTRIFTDDAGREVEIPAEITKIVPAGGLAQIILFAIAPEKFVGVADAFRDNERGYIDDKYFDLPELGSLYASSDLNVEELALVGPEVIIDIGDSKDTATEDMDALQKQTNIPSVFIYATLENMPEAFRTLGDLLGKEERGEELAQWCEKIYDRTLGIMDKVDEDKVDALYVLGEQGLNVIAATSYHAEVLDMLTNNLAVVDNPMGKGTGNEVTMEQLALWDPEFIVFGPGSIYNDVAAMDTWSELQAIKNGNYVEVPDSPHNWFSMPPSAQRYLCLVWLPYVLYPEYCDYDIKAEITEAVEMLFGCTLTDAQYDTLTANIFVK